MSITFEHSITLEAKKFIRFSESLNLSLNSRNPGDSLNAKDGPYED